MAAVLRSDLLDTHSEAEFDEITQLASYICDAPIALISIIDTERQWFKSRIGLDAAETARDISFCGHAIENDALFEVPNALDDERFRDNPLVTGAPNIRFYAGAPLLSNDGFRLGTLCVIDHVARHLSARQRDSLMILSRRISAEIQARTTLRQLDASMARNATLAAELTRSKGFLETLVDTLAIGVFAKKQRADGLWEFVLWNKAGASMTGFAPSDIIGNIDREIFPPDLAREYERSDADIARDRVAVDVPLHRFVRSDGKSRLARTRTVPILDAEGKVEFILGMSEDVTEAVRVSRELAKKQAELVAVSDGSPLGMFRTDARGSCVYVNRKYQQITGLSAQQAYGDGWADALHPEDRERVLDASDAARAGQREFTDSLRYLRTDGSEVLCRVVASAVHVDGVFNGFVGTVDDITERRRVRDALVVSENRLRLIAANLPAMVGYIGADRRYQFTNSAYRDLLGFDPDWMLGKTVEQVYGTARYRTMLPEINAVFRGERVSFERETVVDGELRHQQTDYVPDIDADGHVAGFYAMSVDITARRRGEQQLLASERRMATITDNIPAMVAHIDAGERYLFANAQLCAMMQKSSQAIVGSTMQELLAPELYARLQPYIRRTLAGEKVMFESVAGTPGAELHFQVVYVPDRDVQQNVVGFFATVSNITDRKNNEMIRAASDLRLRLITDNLPMLITYIDSDKRIQFSNGMLWDWMGIAPEAVLGKPFAQVFGSALDQARQTYMERALAGERVEFEIESDVLGVRRHMQAVYIPDRQPDGSIRGFYTLTTDVSTLKRSESKLAQLAHFDTLTGLPNRLLLDQTLSAALVRSKETHTAVAVMYLDIDKFKLVNDTYGHGAGDTVLIEFSRRLERCVRASDTVARLAGDEFVIVLENLTSAAQPPILAQKIIDAMIAPYSLGEVALQLSTSIGIAYGHSASATPAELMASADKSLYAAKSAGRNTFRFAGEPAASSAPHRAPAR